MSNQSNCYRCRPVGRFLAACTLVFSLVFSQSGRAMEGAREFVLSCSYGALAGTLVGAATLAFSEKPGDNLNNIARGASLGLYAGILLGLYVVYGVPSQPSEEDLYVDADAWLKGTAHRNEPKAFIYPLISERGLEGASARVQLVSF